MHCSAKGISVLLSARQFSFLRQKFKTQKQQQSKYLRKNLVKSWCAKTSSRKFKESKRRTAWLLHIRAAWCYNQSITAQEKFKFDQYLLVACQNLPWIFIFEIIKLCTHLLIIPAVFQDSKKQFDHR